MRRARCVSRRVAWLPTKGCPSGSRCPKVAEGRGSRYFEDRTYSQRSSENPSGQEFPLRGKAQRKEKGRNVRDASQRRQLCLQSTDSLVLLFLATMDSRRPSLLLLGRVLKNALNSSSDASCARCLKGGRTVQSKKGVSGWSLAPQPELEVNETYHPLTPVLALPTSNACSRDPAMKEKVRDGQFLALLALALVRTGGSSALPSPAQPSLLPIDGNVPLYKSSRKEMKKIQPPVSHQIPTQRKEGQTYSSQMSQERDRAGRGSCWSSSGRC